MAAPEITVTFNPPIGGESGAVFDAKAFDTMGKLNPWGLEANAVAAYCNQQSSYALASAVAAAAGSLDLADRQVFAGQLVGIEDVPGYPLTGFDIQEIPAATQAQAEAGTATDVYMDPLRTKQAIDALGHKPVKFSGLTYTNGGLITQAHGLASRPTRMSVWAVCTTADAGFDVGDIVNVVDQWSASGNHYGATLYADATNVYCQIGNVGLRVHTTGGTIGAIFTPANWTLTLIAEVI